MSAITSDHRAWGMTLAPVLLFLPSFWLAGMGPCTFSHPSVMLIAAMMFVGLEIAALRTFIRGFRQSISSVAGAALAVVLLVASGWLGYTVVSEFM